MIPVEPCKFPNAHEPHEWSEWDDDYEARDRYWCYGEGHK